MNWPNPAKVGAGVVDGALKEKPVCPDEAALVNGFAVPEPKEKPPEGGAIEDPNSPVL